MPKNKKQTYMSPRHRAEAIIARGLDNETQEAISNAFQTMIYSFQGTPLTQSDIGRAVMYARSMLYIEGVIKSTTSYAQRSHEMPANVAIGDTVTVLVPSPRGEDYMHTGLLVAWNSKSGRAKVANSDGVVKSGWYQPVTS